MGHFSSFLYLFLFLQTRSAHLHTAAIKIEIQFKPYFSHDIPIFFVPEEKQNGLRLRISIAIWTAYPPVYK